MKILVKLCGRLSGYGLVISALFLVSCEKPLTTACDAFSYDPLLCAKSKDTLGRACFFDEGAKKCLIASESPLSSECDAFRHDPVLCNKQKDSQGRACFFDEASRRCLILPAPPPAPDCDAFSYDPELCNKSRDSKNEICLFEVASKTCVSQAEILAKLQEIARIKKEAQKKAERIIGTGSIADYCTSKSIKSNETTRGHLREALNLLKFAADDPASFCAQEYKKIEDIFFMSRPHESCLNTIIEACIEPSDYQERFIQSLKKLEKTSESDKSSIDKLIGELEEKHGRQRHNMVWGVKNVPRSYLEEEPWIIDSPRYNDSERKSLDPVHHSENFLRAWGDAIARGEHFVDITTLVVPQGRFMVELKNSLKILDAKDKPIIVRMLFGAHIPQIGLEVNVKKLLADLLAELRPDTKLRIYIGTLSGSSFFSKSNRKYFSWNHSKIVAVDDKILLTGGHNLVEAYLNAKNPVHDISLKFNGDIALIAHIFCDYLWNFAFWTPEPGFLSLKFGEIATNSVKNHFREFSFENADRLTSKLGLVLDRSIAAPEAGSERVIAMSRLANMFRFEGHHDYNVADFAKLQMIKSATEAIYISQQAIYPIILDNQFNKDVVQELIRAMLRKVDVFLLKSSTKKAISGGIDAYNSGLNRINTFKYFYDQSSDVEANKLKVLTALFEHFMLLDTANGNSEVPNHAKVLIIDTKFSNVASQNLYDMSHSEFESILRNSKILLDYFASFWFSSIPAKYTSYERKNLAAYHIGDYVFTALRYNQTNIREAWTLARVIAKKAGELIIETDFLGTRGRITVTNNELIKPAFIY